GGGGGGARMGGGGCGSGCVGPSATAPWEQGETAARAEGGLITTPAPITATTIDPNPANNSATATTVASNPPPVITLNAPISLWPPNHKYHTVTVAQMVESVSDNCPISVDDVVIEKVTSDEAGNALGDGNTINDIVIG